MDRRIVYPGSIPLDSDLLDLQRATLIAMAWTAQGYLGAGTVVDGLACTPTTPASMSVQVAPGQVFSVQNVDSSTYGSLPTDTVHSILKQGLTLDTTQLTLAAPATVGQSVNYLIQVGFSEVDDTPVVLPYYNAANPAQAYSGPNGSGTAQNTFRRGKCLVQTKAGVAAASGSQVTPAPDPGYVGLYVVTVAYGATTVTAGNIVQLATAPFLLTKLPQVPADVQSGKWLYGVDTGAADALAVALSPAPAGYPKLLLVKKGPNPNTTSTPTIVVDTLGAVPIRTRRGAPVGAGDLAGGDVLVLLYDGAAYRLAGLALSEIFRTKPLQAFVAPSAPNTIATGNVATKITNFGTPTNGIVDVATWNGSLARLTITAAGWYSISIVLDTNLPIGTSGYGVSYSVGYNGGVSIVGNNVFSNSSMPLGPFGSASSLYYLNANDYLEVFAAQNSGVSQNMPIRFSVEYKGQ